MEVQLRDFDQFAFSVEVETMSVISIQVTYNYISVAELDVKTGEVICYMDNEWKVDEKTMDRSVDIEGIPITPRKEAKGFGTPSLRYFKTADDQCIRDEEFNGNVDNSYYINERGNLELLSTKRYVNPASNTYAVLTFLQMTLESYSNITTIIISSRMELVWREFIEATAKKKNGEVKVLSHQQFSRVVGLQQLSILESIFLSRSMSNSEKYPINWKYHVSILKSHNSLLEPLGALLIYLSDRGILLAEADNETMNEQLSFSSNNILTTPPPTIFQSNLDSEVAPRKKIKDVDNTPKRINSDDKKSPLSFISSIYCKSMEKLVYMDKGTFEVLKIFRVDQPNLTNGKGLYSLFEILNFTVTSMGKELLRSWMQKPIRCIRELARRHAGIDYLLHENSIYDFAYEILQHLKGMKDLKKIVHRMHLGRATVRDWSSLLNALINFKKVTEILRNEMKRENKMLPKILKIYPGRTEEENEDILMVLEEDISECIQLLSRTIDWSESKIQKRLIVLQGIDEELDHLKNIYDGLDQLLNKVAVQEIQKLPQSFKTIACAYFPQVGFLIQIPFDNIENGIDFENIHPSLEYRFKTEDSIYCKNDAMRDLDVTIGDIHGYIMDKEEEVVREIEKFLLENEYAFGLITDMVSRLDCILSLARASSEYNLVKPILNEKSTVLNIVNGRNIILEQSGQRVIENSIHSNENSRRMHILTGANGSGKSAFLRQIGLISYMAFIGSHVPCESAEIGVIDRIMSKIQTQDSVNSQLSSFSYDLKLINNILQSYTRNSLVLLDEFGKGSLALDGISLLGAVLNYFIREDRQYDCPRIFVTTHYTEIFDSNIVPLDNVYVELLRTEVSFLPGKEIENYNEAQLIYLYKVVPCNKPDGSYGIACAQGVGISKEIISRAYSIRQKLYNHEYIPPLQMKEQKSYEECMEIIQMFLATNLEDTTEVENLKRKVLGKSDNNS